MVILTKNGVNPIGRWVLITGCDSGFGFLSTLFLLEQGFGVISACLTEKGKNALIEASEGNPHLHVYQCDVTDSQQVEELIKNTQEITDNELWALVNNAGIVIPGCIDFLEQSDFRKVMEVNFFAAVSLTLKCIPMLKHSRGRIINLSSTCGFCAMPANGPYNSSKFALEGLSDTLRRDLKIWGINVSVIEPGTMRTTVSQKYYPMIQEAFNKAPESVQLQYGRANIEKFCQKNEKRINKIAEDPILVIRDIHHAVQSKHPKIRYRPGKWAKLYFPMIISMRTRRTDRILQFATGVKSADKEKSRGKFRVELYESFHDNVENVWSEWLDYLWNQGTEYLTPPRIEIKGDRHGSGSVRFIPFFKNWGIREGITETDYPKKLFYKVMNPSWFTFPVRTHYGMVRFIPINNNTTLIKWVIYFTPKPLCKLLIFTFLKFMAGKNLSRLKSYIEKKT